MYRAKLTTVDGALDLIHDGDFVGHSGRPCEPEAFLSKLHTIAGRINHIGVASMLNFTPHEFLMNPEYKDKFTIKSNFFGSATRESNRRGLASYVPGHLFKGYQYLLERRPADVFVMMVSPTDKHGYFHTVSLAETRDFLNVAKTVIVEVNENMPRMPGNNAVHIRDVAAIIENNAEHQTIPRMQPSETDREIASRVKELVHDGDTLQVGIGSMPDCLLSMLTDRNDLGLHTEMIASSMADLIELGVVNGKRKTLFRGKTLGSFVTGDKALYEYVADNPHFVLRSTNHVNDPRVICQNDNMVAINTALAVDLSGQIASEGLGASQYSGTGGQFCYAQGAAWSKNGRFIIAMKSTAKNGSISTIMPSLAPCTPVTVPRTDADYVITEYGTVRLRGMSIRERTEALISIARPKFRDELTERAKEINYI